MKRALVVLFSLGVVLNVFADDYVYDSPYGGTKVGRIEDNGKIYDEPYGGKAVGRYDDGKVYNDPYGGKAIGSAGRREGAGYFLLREGNPENRKK
jgi:hypothetical protein